MKQLIFLATLSVIFLCFGCQKSKEKLPLSFFSEKITQLTYVDGSKEAVSAYLKVDLDMFFNDHSILLGENPFWLGKTDRYETLFIQQTKSDIFQQWLTSSETKVVEFHGWNIYQLKIENGRIIHICYSDEYLWVSNRGFLLEESLMAMGEKVNGLIEKLPIIEEIELNETCVSFKEFSVVNLLDLDESINVESLMTSKMIGEINNNDTDYFKGEIFFEKSFKILEDSLWYQSLFLIPSQVIYAGVYQYPLPTKSIFRGKTTGAFASFLLDNEIGEDSPFLLVNTKGLAHDIMNDLEKRYGILEEINENLFPIKRILTNDLCDTENNIPFLPCIQNPFVVMIGDYLIFTNSLEGMEKYLDSYVASQMITQHKTLNSSLDKWKNIKGSFHYFKGVDVEGIEKKESVLILDEINNNKIQATYTIQEVNKKKLGIQKVSTYYNSEKIISDVFILPSKKEEEYIIFQDASFQLNFLNRKNKLLHSLSLEEPIISEIHHYEDIGTHLDRYIFNTKNRIYILNNFGELLHDFPLKLSSPASNGIALINISNTRSLYAFVACENGNLYGYDLRQGLKPMPSWNPLMEMGGMQEDLVFLKGNNETHYALIKPNNEFVSLNREAGMWFNPISIETEYNQGIQVDESTKDKERFVLHNGKGKLKIINLNGKQFSLFLNNENKEGQFLLMNLKGSQQKEYVFMSKEHISIHSYEVDDFKPFIKINNDYGITELFEVKTKNEHSILGGINQVKNKTYLFNSEGELMEGFPLEGSAPFKMKSIGNQQYLIFTIMEDKMIIYVLTSS